MWCGWKKSMRRNHFSIARPSDVFVALADDENWISTRTLGMERKKNPRKVVSSGWTLDLIRHSTKRGLFACTEVRMMSCGRLNRCLRARIVRSTNTKLMAAKKENKAVRHGQLEMFRWCSAPLSPKAIKINNFKFHFFLLPKTILWIFTRGIWSNSDYLHFIG